MTTANSLASLGSAGVSAGFKNRIINGAMVIDQRNAGASVTPTNNSYTLDRWNVLCSQASKFTLQQNAGSITPPVGFSNYLGCTSSSAYSVTSSDYFSVRQMIEGFNTSDLGWGTANAKTVTLSFQVYSSLTGTFGGAIQNYNGTRNYPFSYSVPVANTWTTISVTIAGDTTGTWVGSTNGIGLQVMFSLGTGSTYSGTAGSWSGTQYFSATGATSVVSTSGATFYITGVQLEVGSSATGFEYRQYGQELALCQRYYQRLGGDGYAAIGSGINFGGAQVARACSILFISTMRTAPSASIIGTLIVTDRTDYDTPITAIVDWSPSTTSANAGFSKNSNTGGDRVPVQIAVQNGTTSVLALSAEL